MAGQSGLEIRGSETHQIMISSEYEAVVTAAKQYLNSTNTLTELSIDVQQIAAPTGDEYARAQFVYERMRKFGLGDLQLDEESNVYGRIRGRHSDKPALLVSAHTDTVFPRGTDLAIKHSDDHRIYGPGIGDNSTGVASLLALAETLSTLEPPPVDIWLAANTGEEGLGDLRGMRFLVDQLEKRIGAAIVIEGMGLGRIVHRGLGSIRIRISVEAPGGHSWSDFGTPSAVHVLSLIASDIVRLKVPKQPRTTFNIGRFEGGTTVNTIAQQATLDLDMRSEDPTELKNLVVAVQRIISRHQTTRWKKWGVKVKQETIGERPAGEIAQDHPLVQAAENALVAAGLTSEPDLRVSSTDANIPLSRGIPAVCIGIVHGGNAHRLEEWIDPRNIGQGMQHLLLLTWWAANWLADEGD